MLVVEVLFAKEKSKTSASMVAMSSNSTWNFSFQNWSFHLYATIGQKCSTTVHLKRFELKQNCVSSRRWANFFLLLCDSKPKITKPFSYAEEVAYYSILVFGTTGTKKERILGSRKSQFPLLRWFMPSSPRQKAFLEIKTNKWRHNWGDYSIIRVFVLSANIA